MTAWDLGRRWQAEVGQQCGRRGLADSQARVALGNFPTRLSQLDELGARLGVDLWVKHEFEADGYGSGNKVRKLEFLIPEIVGQEYTGLVSDGTTQSNCAMALALYAVRFGLSVDLVLYGSTARQGNYVDILRSDAAVTLIPKWHRGEILREQRRIVAKAASEGRRLYTVPPGATTEMSVLAGVDLVAELAKQEDEIGFPFDYVIIATASGGTQAGLELGRLIHGRSWTLISVAVANDVAFFRNVVNSIACGPLFAPLVKRHQLPMDLKIHMGALGGDYGGYGIALPGASDEIRQLRNEFGLVLDSVYTHKAFVGMKQLIANGEIPGGSSVLLIHTGGLNERFIDLE
jgi:D-cysteine desulfhydrase